MCTGQAVASSYASGTHIIERATMGRLFEVDPVKSTNCLHRLANARSSANLTGTVKNPAHLDSVHASAAPPSVIRIAPKYNGARRRTPNN